MDELAEEAGGEDGEVEESDARQSAGGVGGQDGSEEGGQVRGGGSDVAIHRGAGEERTEHLQYRLGQQEHQRDGDPQAVGAHVAQQTAHQSLVVCLAEDFFFHSLQSSGVGRRSAARGGDWYDNDGLAGKLR